MKLPVMIIYTTITQQQKLQLF